MSKPRIKMIRRAGFSQIIWKCIGVNRAGEPNIGYGISPRQAYEDWQIYFDFTW